MADVTSPRARHRVTSSSSPRETSHVTLNRRPGESLGMVLAIEGDQEGRTPVEVGRCWLSLQSSYTA